MKKSLHIVIAGNRVRERRGQIRVNQDVIADSVGVSRQTVNTWEGKESFKLSPEVAEKLAEALKTNVKDLTFIVSKNGHSLDSNQAESEEIRLLIKNIDRIGSTNEYLLSRVKELEDQLRSSRK